MMPSERRERIVARINADGSAQVNDLSTAFGVTPDCIRKDLALLEKDGLVERVHGGARAKGKALHAYSVADRKEMRTGEKAKVAAHAFDLIEDGMTIFLDVSTNALALARLIYEADLSVTIVTNMIDIMTLFARPTRTRVITLGGTYNNAYDGFTGTATNRMMEAYMFDIAFLGAVGIHAADNAVTTYDEDDGATKALAASKAHQVCLLAESAKFTLGGNFVWTTLDDIDILATDTMPPQKIKKVLSQHKVAVRA